MSSATEKLELAEDISVRGTSELVRRPRTIAETGLDITFLADLLSKHLATSGAASTPSLVQRVALPSKIVDEVLHFLRQEARVEVLGTQADDGALRYTLTDRGRALAASASEINGYAGAAPIPLDKYLQLVAVQSIHDRPVSHVDMQHAFKDVVLSDDLMHRLGPSLNSGRSLFIYGPAGTGKTYITQRFSRVFRDSVFIPKAILVHDVVLPIFDPVMHQAIDRGVPDTSNINVESACDERLVLCQRPALVVGGELTMSMLEVQYDPHTREHQAPLQLKANNGIFIIDDMGRQKASPQEIFNRWIVPMEEKRDYLSLGSGRHFGIPFNVVIVFSTNMNPTDLADEAFLRRIGYKIEFPYLTREQYAEIWQQQCAERGVPFEEKSLSYVVDCLHRVNGVPMLPCHPRDLIGLCVDKAVYTGKPRQLTEEIINWAWENYFANTQSTVPSELGEVK